MSPKEDAIDVEFETIAAQNIADVSSKKAKTNTSADSAQIDEGQLAVFAQPKARSDDKAMSLPVFTLIAALCTVAAFYLAGGHILFDSSRTPPRVETALANTMPAHEQTLKIEDITSRIVERNDLKVLTIRATIANHDDKAQTIPTMIVRLGDDPATGRMFRINRGETLKPGERLVFTNSLPVGNAPDTKPQLSFSE